MRVLVCGSRGWSDVDAIARRLDDLRAIHPSLVVVHGGARGADRIAGSWASRNGVRSEVFPAKWDLYGKSAGPRRNQEMLESGIDVVLAFRLDGRSFGTDDMVRRAKHAGVPVTVVRPT